MFLIYFQLLLHLKRPLGIINTIPHLHGANFTQFLRNHDRSIVFFTNQTNIQFAYPAIYEYQSQFGFVMGDLNEAPKDQCSNSDFCVIVFDKTKPKNIPQPNLFPASFLTWVKQLTHPEYFEISSTVDIYRLLHFEFSSILAVGYDLSQTPISSIIDFSKFGLPNDTIIYSIHEKLISQILRVKISQGIYVLRGIDYQLVPLTQPSDLVSPLTPMTFYDDVNNFTSPDLQVPTLVAAYFANERSYEFVADEYNILLDLATNSSFSTSFLFSFFNGVKGNSFLPQLDLDERKPFFVVFDRTSVKYRRWYDFSITNRREYISQIHSRDYIVNYLKQIKNGLKPTIVSQPEPKQSKDEYIRSIVGSNFKRTVFNDQFDSVVVFTALDNERSDQLVAIVNAVNHLLKEISSLKFYRIEARRNDLPRNAPDKKDVPLIAIYPAGKKADMPIVYDFGERMKSFLNTDANSTDASSFIDFLKEKVTHPFHDKLEKMQVNVTQINEDINLYLKKQRDLRRFLQQKNY